MLMLFRGGGNLSSPLILFSYCCFMTILMLVFFLSSYSFLLEIVLIKVGSFSFSFPILLGWENCLVTVVVCFISGCVLIYSKAYMVGEMNFNRFINLVCLFILSMNLLIFIPSLLFLFLGWDGLGIVSFILVIFYQNKSSLGSGMITVLTNRIGDVFLFLSISMSGCLGYWCWEGLRLSQDFISGVDFFIFSLSIVVAGMTKSAQFPFCAWLPAAMAAPTPVSALVHSSTLVTAGVFLLCRFSGVLLANPEMCQFLFLISLMTMLLSGGVCCVEWDMKKVIAFSTLSQLGVMMFSVSLGLINFGLFHLITHAVFKALMFLCAGFVICYSSHSQDFRCLGGFWWVSPIMSGSAITSIFCLSGMPFLSGFYSKDLILEEFLMTNISIGGMFCLILATSFTVCYSVRLCVIILSGKEGLELSSKKISMFYYTPLVMLEVLGIFEGGLIQSIMESFMSFSFVFGYLKKGLESVLLVSTVLGLAMILASKKNYYFSVYSLFSILYLSEVSGQIFSKESLFFAKKSYEVLDQGGFEVFLGGSGLNLLGNYFSNTTMKIMILNSVYNLSLYLITLLVFISGISFYFGI
uniref:NADH-ubiquinone oxidoreductase chain 5 n=1 Tax=Thyasira tokunagai TaxID=3055801 RepID=A0AB39CCA8_9BIVA